MSALRVTGLPGSRRVYFGRARIHHGAIGSLLVASGLLRGGPAGLGLILVGAGLAFHDRRDIPWCFDR